MANNNLSNANAARDADFAIGKVSSAGKKGFWALIFIFIGWGMNTSEAVSGGLIGSQLGLTRGIIATIAGTLILLVYVSFLSYMASNSGYGFGLLTRFAFGNIGSKVPSAVIGFSNFGWYGILVALCATSFVTTFGWNRALVTAVLGILMMLSAIFGVKGMSYLSYVAVPTCLIIGVWAMASVMNMADGNNAPTVESNMTLAAGISTAIAAYISGGTLSCDISRFSRKPSHAIISTFIGLLIGLLFMRIMGIFCMVRTGANDIVDALIMAGMAGIGLLFILFNIWTTNDNILYSSGLMICNIFGWKRVRVTVIAGVIGTFLAVIGIANVFEGFLNFLGIAIPPVGGIVIADYYLIRRRQYGELSEIQYKFNPIAFVSWILASALSYFFGDFGVQALNSIWFAVVLYTVLMLIVKLAKPDYYATLVPIAKKEESDSEPAAV